MTEIEDDDDSIEINLRSSQEIGIRLAILAAVLARVGLESNAPVGGNQEDVADAEEERLDLIAWLRSEGADGSVSFSEAALLHATVGSLPFDSVAESSWQAERLAVVAWAASLTGKLAELHQEADISAVLAQIPTPWDSVADFVIRLTPRSDDEIAVEIERAEVWLWRAETEEARRGASREELLEIAEAIAEVGAEGAEMGLLERAPDGDFLANGKPFHRLSDDARTKIAIIASERLRALNWLRGAENDWDHLTVDL